MMRVRGSIRLPGDPTQYADARSTRGIVVSEDKLLLAMERLERSARAPTLSSVIPFVASFLTAGGSAYWFNSSSNDAGTLVFVGVAVAFAAFGANTAWQVLKARSDRRVSAGDIVSELMDSQEQP